jgi:PIN domain nuclease of toxin-antitoxin system
MRLLVDSHVLLWWLQGSGGLSADAIAAMRRRTNDVFVSVATLWELAIKRSLGKLKVDVDLREHVREQRFEELPIVGEHAEAVQALPRWRSVRPDVGRPGSVRGADPRHIRPRAHGVRRADTACLV